MASAISIFFDSCIITGAISTFSQAVMSLIQSAKLNGHGPWAYLKDVLARLPTHLARHVDELLPRNWPKKPIQQLC